MKQILDLDVPDVGLSLQQLIKDCAVTLKYQVRTGKVISVQNTLTGFHRIYIKGFALTGDVYESTLAH